MGFFAGWQLTYISKRKLLLITFIVMATAALLRYSFIHSVLEQNIAHNLNFRVRTLLGQDPPVDARIKIFIFDDPTVSYADALDIDLQDWAKVFQALDERKPGQIIVDKLFFMPRGRENATEFVKTTQALGTEVSVALFLNPNEIANREEFTETDRFDLRKWRRSPTLDDSLGMTESKISPTLDDSLGMTESKISPTLDDSLGMTESKRSPTLDDSLGMTESKRSPTLDDSVGMTESKRSPTLDDSLGMTESDTVGMTESVLPDWLKVKSLHIYGSDSDIRPAFGSFGHIVYRGNGLVEPLVRVSENQVVPHVSFTLDDPLLAKGALIDGDLYINGHKVHTDTAGQVQINIIPPERLKKVYSMKTLIERARERKPISVVDDGDIVVILPAMFTGNTDWIPTPVGYIPGGYLIVSMVNSVLTGNWLYLLNDLGSLTFLAAAAGILIGTTLWAPTFWLVLAGIIAVVPVAATLGFVFGGVFVSWLSPSIAFTIGASAVFAERTRAAKLEQIRIGKELETARLVQNTFFPKNNAADENLFIEGFYQPASECGGDWWGHFSHGENKYIMIGDALGHGVGAALMTGMAYSACMTISDLMRSEDLMDRRPATLLSRLNRILCEAVGGESSMTFFIANLDMSLGILTYANAGHVFPVLIPKDPNDKRIQVRSKKFEPFDRYPVSMYSAGNPLGIHGQSNYIDSKIQLAPGDRIFFFSDALVECAGKDGRPWGRKIMLEQVVRYAKESAAAMRDSIVSAALKDLGHILNDDLTVVVVEVSEQWCPQAERNDIPSSKPA